MDDKTMFSIECFGEDHIFRSHLLRDKTQRKKWKAHWDTVKHKKIKEFCQIWRSEFIQNSWGYSLREFIGIRKKQYCLYWWLSIRDQLELKHTFVDNDNPDINSPAKSVPTLSNPFRGYDDFDDDDDDDTCRNYEVLSDDDEFSSYP